MGGVFARIAAIGIVVGTTVAVAPLAGATASEKVVAAYSAGTSGGVLVVTGTSDRDRIIVTPVIAPNGSTSGLRIAVATSEITGCAPQSTHETICNDVHRLTISGKTGDDDIEVSAAAAETAVFGGAGDDFLISSSESYPIVDVPTTLDGGPGRDLLVGSTSRFARDVLRGGSGPDTMTARDGDDDEADYRDRSVGVQVSLDGVANDGEPGEGDNVLADVDIVNGGHGNDVLTGSPQRESLLGWDGNDTLRGLGGDDYLSGGIGVDRFDGGPGNDRIQSDDDVREVVSCGGGKNDVATTDPLDRVRGCEHVYS